MRFLLDTDWIISFLNGRPTAVSLATDLLDRGLAVSVISYGEACEGVMGSPEFERSMEALDELASLTELLTTDLTIARPMPGSDSTLGRRAN